MRFAPLLLALLFLVPAAPAQDATQDIRLRLVSNDATAGGTLVVAVEARTSADRAPNISLGSGTIDVSYDSDHLTLSAFGGGVDNADGYSVTPSQITCNGLGGDCWRFGITSSGIGDTFLDDPGYNIGTTYTELFTLGFTLDATSAEATALVIDRSTLSVGYYNSLNNSPEGDIEDNTGTAGDDVVDFLTVEDLSVRTATFNAGANWYLVGMPGSGATLDDLAGPFWTQGFTGSDAGTDGSPNVVFWDETAGAYATPGAQTDAVAAGTGLFLYVYADDDNDGSDEAFPKSVTVGATPVNDQGSPVNATDPNPYAATLPFTFPVTYTTEPAPQGPGWNLLSNPTDENIDWDDAGWTRTNLSTALYTYTGTGYLTWTPGVGGDRGNGVIAPFEGFWSEATAASPVLTMPSDAYGAVVPPAREAGLPPAVRLHVAGEVAGQALADEAFVAFLDGAEAERDIYDAHELLGFTTTQLHLFTQLETGETFTTDVRPPLDKSDVEVALDVTALAAEADVASTLTLTWPELRGLTSDIPVQLIDLETETIIDLWTETEYTFSVSSTAQRSAEGKETDVLAMTGPQTLRSTLDRSARSADKGRFLLFVGSEARMPVSTVSEEEAVFELAAPAPNPTRGTTRLRYSLAEAGEASISVYDMLGRSVSVAASGLHAAGRHDVVIDTDAFAPGLYVVRLEADGQAATQSLTVVR